MDSTSQSDLEVPELELPELESDLELESDSDSDPESDPEGKPFAVEVEDVNKILLHIIESSMIAVKNLENLKTLDVLELYNKHLKTFNEQFVHTNRKLVEDFLVRGRQTRYDWRKTLKPKYHKGAPMRFDSITIVMFNAKEANKDEFTFHRFSACVAYNYYENVVSKLDSLEEMIIPSSIAACSPLPMDTDDKDYLKYNKLFCLAVNGVQYIPKMMKNAGKSDDLIGGVLTICLLIDYIRCKEKFAYDKGDFTTFLCSDAYEGDRVTFINAVANYGIDEIVELMAKESSLKMLQLFMRHGCTIELKVESSRKKTYSRYMKGRVPRRMVLSHLRLLDY